MNDKTVRCKYCGSARFHILETYKLECCQDLWYEKSYILSLPQTQIKCAECNGIYEESSTDKKINLEKNKK